MAWYAFWQQEGGEDRWELMLAEQRERIIKDRTPAFTTILDVDNDFKGQMTQEEIQKVHYRGPLYFDFDSSSIEEVIPKFKKFLLRLRDEFQFDLEQAQLFATGGKGFHCVIPMQCFIPKVPVKGVMALPYIYKEMALEVFVDTLDLRVYTAKRGRQFRTANVKRTNGKYKVPIQVKEALEMTVEMYEEFVSAPRPATATNAPELNPQLALLYSTSHDKVDKASKNRKKSKLDTNLLKRFGKDVPPSILSAMSGENLADGVGFQKIAMQLSLAAHALGKTEEQFLSLCDGLCENHVSDGTRYNTPSKRRNELSRMFQYLQDNPCYDFSIGGIKALLHPDTQTTDLDNGNVDLGDEDEDEEELEHAISQGIRVSPNGIFKKTEAGLVRVSALGMSAPCHLIDVATDESKGYEVDIYVNGRKKGRKWLEMSHFMSRNRFLQFSLATGGVNMNATDQQVGAIADILLSRAVKNNRVVYTTSREGVDYVMLPDGRSDVIWADNSKVISKLGVNYRLVGKLSDSGEYRTDLMNAPAFEVNETSKEFFRKLFNINRPDVIGKLLGWYSACFFSQLLRHQFNKFPLMQVFGPAGSGKTDMNQLFANLHYYEKQPKLVSAMNQTPFVMDAYASGSGSIPLILDEFKPREMRRDRLDKAKSIIRDNYNGAEAGRGQISDSSGQSKLSLNSAENKAPIVFLGEALESQTAILERCVMVNVNKEGKRGHYNDFLFCQNHRTILGQLGKLCVERTLEMDVTGLRNVVTKYVASIQEAVGDRSGDSSRPIYNMAVVLTGLEFTRRIIEELFDGEFDDDFKRMREGIIGRTDSLVPRVMSEVSKVLDTMAHMSRAEDDERTKLLIGKDYVVDGSVLYIRLKNAYAKYLRYRRTTGEEALFDSTEAFIAAMSNYGGVVDTQGIDCEILKDAATTVVYGLSLEHLAGEGVGEFR